MKSPRFILLAFLYFTEAINNYDGHEPSVKNWKKYFFYISILYI